MASSGALPKAKEKFPLRVTQYINSSAKASMASLTSFLLFCVHSKRRFALSVTFTMG